MSSPSLGDGPALVVLPGRARRAAGVQARRLAAANLSAAFDRVRPGTRFLDLAGSHPTEDAIASAVNQGEVRSPGRRLVAGMPRVVRPVFADVGAMRADRAMASRLRVLDGRDVGFVVQFHHRFQSAGVDAAHRWGVPAVLRVEALEVQEEASWGVRRPYYGRTVERRGEHVPFRRADLLLPVTAAVDRGLAEAGIPGRRRMVLPNGVDVRMFVPGAPDPVLRRAAGAEGRFLVGWVGGFRTFHGLSLVEPTARALRELVPGAVICLVGGGPLHGELVRRARSSDGAVRVMAPVAHAEVARWIRSFDACVIFGEPGPFHYAPLKLEEYRACGRPVVVPRVGDLPDELLDERDALLVPPGDPAATARALARLKHEPRLATALGENGRRAVLNGGSWDARVRAILSRLEEVRPVSTDPAHA